MSSSFYNLYKYVASSSFYKLMSSSFYISLVSSSFYNLYFVSVI